MKQRGFIVAESTMQNWLGRQNDEPKRARIAPPIEGHSCLDLAGLALEPFAIHHLYRVEGMVRAVVWYDVHQEHYDAFYAVAFSIKGCRFYR